MTAHGFRSPASTIRNERWLADPDVIEAAGADTFGSYVIVLAVSLRLGALYVAYANTMLFATF